MTDPPNAAPAERAAQVAAALAGVDRRLSAACAAVGRSRAEVTLIAVAKTFPAGDVLAALRAGVPDIGENKVQELRAKAAEVSALLAAGQPGGAVPGTVRWHMVGRLQRNKCRAVGQVAAAVHSVDRVELLRPLARGAEDAGRTLDLLIQVSLDGDPHRGGIAPAGAAGLAATAAATDGLRVRGVMAVAPRGGSPSAAFAALREVAEQLRADHPDADWISAGMSGDLEDAVAEGATHVRVGSAVFGRRPPPVG